jgi:hypothetical protein
MKGDEERYVQALKRVRAGSPESSAEHMP